MHLMFKIDKDRLIRVYQHFKPRIEATIDINGFIK